MSSLKFQRLVIHNFKSFSGKHVFELDRPAGLYYITGNNLINPELGANGCGKTGLWDALTWCLTGKTGRDTRPANAVVPWDLKRGTTKVELEFYRARKKHTLSRSRNPNELILNGGTTTQQEVDSTIGMSEEMFRRTIVLGQFGSLFLDLRPEEQTRMFNEALNLDLWLKASSIASQKQKGLHGQFTGTRVELSKLDGRQTELQNQLEREIRASESFSSNQNEQRNILKKKLAARENKLRSFLTDNPVPTVQAQAPTAKGKDTASTTRQQAVASLETASARLGREIREIEIEVRSLTSKINSNQEELLQYRNAINGNRACPACGQTAPLSHLKEKAKDCRTRISEQETAKGKLDKHRKAREDALDEVDSIIKEQRKLITEQSSLENEVELATRELSRFSKQDNPHASSIQDINKSLSKLAVDKEELKKLQDTLSYQAGVCEYWVGAFKEIRLSLIDSALLELEMAVTRHTEALGLTGWLVKFATERVKASGDVSTTFTVLLHPPDRDEPIKFESYSGGESQRLQLAVAFGLSEVILARAGVNPSIEVLDEPTRGLSPEGVNDLLEHLAQRAEDLDRAIFCTEHHSLERGLFTSMITIEKTSDGSRILEDGMGK